MRSSGPSNAFKSAHPLIARGVDGDKVETGEKSLGRRARFVVDGVEFCQRVQDRGAERVAVEMTP